LVFFDSGFGPHAAVYPIDANAFTNPDLVFPIDAFQELPLVRAGAAANIDSLHVVRAAGVVVKPSGHVLQEIPGGGSRLFAERGDVLVSPTVGGWSDTWQERRPDSALPAEEHARRGRRRVMAFWAWIAYFVLLVIGLIALWVTTGRAPVIYATSWIGVGFAVRAAANRRRHALVAKRSAQEVRARPAGPIEQFPVRLWWAAGFGDGPVAVLEIERQAGSGLSIPVTGVPQGFSLAPGAVAMVQGPVDDGQAYSVTVQGEQFWPIAPAFARPVPLADRENR
jgi:hypothetical protein